MALGEFLKSLEDLAADAVLAFESAESDQSLEAARVAYLGAKQGKLKTTQKQMSGLDQLDRPAAGKRLNEVKQAIESAFLAARQRLAASPAPAVRSSRGGPSFDPTLPGRPLRLGRLHPITQTIEELKDIMGRLGFSVADGPEIEDEWHNFEALNIPVEHPARDPLDNFYLSVAEGGAGPDASPPQPDQHGADPRDGADAAAGADYLAGPRVSP